MINIVNLTPHELTLCGEDGKVVSIIPATGKIARCKEMKVQIGSVNGIPIYRMYYGEVTDLPAPARNTIYVVNSITAAAVKGRDDVFIPGGAVRDAAGRIVGCTGLARHDEPCDEPEPINPMYLNKYIGKRVYLQLGEILIHDAISGSLETINSVDEEVVKMESGKMGNVSMYGVTWQLFEVKNEIK